MQAAATGSAVTSAAAASAAAVSAASVTCDARPVQERLAMRGPCVSDLRCAARTGAAFDARPVLARLAIWPELAD